MRRAGVGRAVGAVSPLLAFFGSLAPLASLASCGDPAVSLAVYDTPLFVMTGVYNPSSIEPTTSPRVGVVWTDPWEIEDDVPAPPQTTRFQQTASGFSLSFYAPPPDRTIQTFDDPKTHVLATRFAFGEIVFYDDADLDGTFAITSRAANSEIVAPDRYWGASSHEVLRYLETPLAERSPLLPDLSGMLVGPPGFGIAVVTCVAATPPYATSAPADRVVTIQVDKGGSTTLPSERTCLRTRSVDDPVPSPPSP